MRLLALAAAVALSADDVAPPKASWTAECTIDEMDDHRSCVLRNANIIPALVVIAVGKDVAVFPGEPDFPGRTSVTLRVDKNKAVTYDVKDEKGLLRGSAAALEQMTKGAVVRFEWTHWPEKIPERAALDLTGFAEAYREFNRLRALKGPAQWAPPATRDGGL